MTAGMGINRIRRQGVQDLISAMAAVDCMVDYKMVDTIDTMQKSKLNGGKKSKADG